MAIEAGLPSAAADKSTGSKKLEVEEATTVSDGGTVTLSGDIAGKPVVSSENVDTIATVTDVSGDTVTIGLNSVSDASAGADSDVTIIAVVAT